MHWELKDITVWHLERLAPLPDPPPSRAYELVNLVDPDPGFCRYLYATVGAPWLWYEKIGWSLSEWQHHVNQPNLQFWVAYVAGNPIGYFEINHGNDGASEICLFGLMPNWVGKGLGSALLQDAINQAFKPDQRRIWLHTCSLDHPNALPNYTKHGFNLFKEERFTAKVPAEPLEPFPGAYSP